MHREGNAQERGEYALSSFKISPLSRSLWSNPVGMRRRRLRRRAPPMVTYSTVIFFCERDQIPKLLKIVCLCEWRIILYDTRDGYVYLGVCVYVCMCARACAHVCGCTGTCLNMFTFCFSFLLNFCLAFHLFQNRFKSVSTESHGCRASGPGALM